MVKWYPQLTFHHKSLFSCVVSAARCPFTGKPVSPEHSTASRLLPPVSCFLPYAAAARCLSPVICWPRMNPKEVLEFAKQKEVRQFDLRFTDLPGLSQHVSYPISQLDEDSFEAGFAIDGSSIRGWAAINESDMLLIPDPSTAHMDPFGEIRTLVMTSDVIDPITRQHYERDPRWIARKAEMYLKNSGIADTAYFGAEAEFFIFDNVRFDQNQHSGFYCIDAEEGRWNSGREGENLGYRPRYKEGYFPVPPTDHYQDLRAEMVETMIRCGINIECHHHEVATGGQCEIDQRFDTLIKSADNMMLYKYVIRK